MILSQRGVNSSANPSAYACRYKCRHLGAWGFMSLPAMFMIMALGSAAFLAFKLVPAYLDHTHVTIAMQKLSEETDELHKLTDYEIRSHFERYFAVNGVESALKDSIEVDRSNGRVVVSIDYTKQAHIAFNVDALIHFKNAIDSRFPGECCDADHLRGQLVRSSP